MYLSEIPRGASVNITVKNKSGASAVFQTVAVEGTRIAGQRHTLIITCIRHNGKIVNFDGFAMTATINLPGADSRSCSFVINSVATTKRGTQTCHVLFSNDNATPRDRRDAIRVDLNEPATIKIGDRPQITVVAKDLSISGISFLVPASVTAKVDDVLDGAFAHIPLNATYQISATIVRIEPTKDGRLLIGCRLNNFNKSIVALVTYLARKQGKGQ
ncbi:MAG: PilZ domain-containing protein [Lachnospiraceae bacterium]|nr:PilZ domain-containing protein [Lachnospiraceae bacterium]